MNRALSRLDSAAEWEAPQPRSRRRILPTAGVAVAVALVAGLVAYGTRAHGGGASALSREATVTGVPTHTHIRSPHRLLPAPSQAATSSSYAFMPTSDGGRVTREPCRAIHYVVHHAEEGPQLDAMFVRAVTEVSGATGLKFVDDGPTAELPLATPTARLAYQPRTYGDRWAPVLIAWSDSSESADALAGAEAGYGGAASVTLPGAPARYVSGTVAFNLPDITTMLAMPHGAALVRVVMLHELAHLVGLDHVQDKTQVMYPRLIGPIDGYQAGDRAGLAKLGLGSCFSDY